MDHLLDYGGECNTGGLGQGFLGKVSGVYQVLEVPKVSQKRVYLVSVQGMGGWSRT